jgi:hypothetical protein
LRIFIISIISILSFIIFGKLPYSINDDFLLNVLYSGGFTRGHAFPDILFQHRYFTDVLIWLNNSISININWYYLLHFILLWLSICGYLILCKSEISIWRDEEFWICLFLGVWFSYKLTFTWVSSILGIMSWLMFLKNGKKSYIHWIFILLGFCFSFLVRPQITILLLIVLNIHCVFLYFFRKKISFTKAKLIFISSILILLFYKILVPNNTENSPLKKYPYQWVTEQSFLKDEIIRSNKKVFDVIDFEVAHQFFYDDRFDGMPNSELNSHSSTLKRFVNSIGLFNYIKKSSRVFFNKFILVFYKSYIIIILFFLILLSHRQIAKDVVIMFIIIFLIECLIFMLTNLRISKERVLMPPFVLIMLYYFFNEEIIIKPISSFSLIGIICPSLILLVLCSGLYFSSILNVKEKKIDTVMDVFEKKLSFRSNAGQKLYSDPTFVMWNYIWSNKCRYKVNNFRTHLLPPSWAMRSLAFEKCLKYSGVSSLQSALDRKKLIILLKNSDKSSVWIEYLNKYSIASKILVEDDYFESDFIELKKLEIID